MDLVEVDVVCAQPTQAVLDLAPQPRRRRVGKHAALVPFEARLGGNVERVAPAMGAHHFADNLLGASAAVDRRRIDKVDAAFDGTETGAQSPHPRQPHPILNRRWPRFPGRFARLRSLQSLWFPCRNILSAPACIWPSTNPIGFIQASGEIKLVPVSCSPVPIDSNSNSGLKRVVLHAMRGVWLSVSFALLSRPQSRKPRRKPPCRPRPKTRQRPRSRSSSRWTKL